MADPTFTEEEKVEIRRHLGYPNVKEASTFALGVPAGIETNFIIEGAMDRVMAAALPQIRRHIAILNKIEEQLIEDQCYLVADSVGSINIRPTEMKELRKEYLWWREGLANLLAVYPNPFDKRQFMTPVNVTVRN